ncbi:hypothetical protein EDC01DRAFT_630713 [Geopyxis carbonaria]|nr:hypothetical protein EDC01DRAFT_630713 [Geopyxis carbonaria]
MTLDIEEQSSNAATPVGPVLSSSSNRKNAVLNSGEEEVNLQLFNAALPQPASRQRSVVQKATDQEHRHPRDHTDLLEIRMELATVRAELHAIETQLSKSNRCPKVETPGIATQAKLLQASSEIRANLAVLLRAVAQIRQNREELAALSRSEQEARWKENFMVMQQRRVQNRVLAMKEREIAMGQADLSQRMKAMEEAEAHLERRRMDIESAEARLMEHAQLTMRSFRREVQKHDDGFEGPDDREPRF